VDSRLVLTAERFLALPAIIERTDLAAVTPRPILLGFINTERYALLFNELPRSSFTEQLHWSHRFEVYPAYQWMRRLLVELFTRSPAPCQKAASVQ
jgi:hypothetical protein